MARRRLAVALLVPQPLATAIDGIRRACGDPRLGRIAPHVTLVPPVNVPEEQVGEILDQCRQAATSTSVLHLTLGAPSTFAPTTPLAWLSVGGDIDAVADLRRRLSVGPLSRPAEHPFVPHVTISDKVAAARLDAMLAALADFEAACTIERLHLLDNRQLDDGRWGWVPVAEHAFGRPAVIGVGGLALELSVGAMVGPDAEALIATGTERGVRSLTVTARQDEAVVGVALGTVRDGLAILGALVVADGHQRQGIGSHLLARFTAEATEMGCSAAIHVSASQDCSWGCAGSAAGPMRDRGPLLAPPPCCGSWRNNNPRDFPA